jgi:hypothetical protein
MEGLAEGGGICISGTVYDAIEAKLGLEYEYLGEQEVKNIDKPVRAYRVLSFPGAAAHRVIKAKKQVRRKWLGFLATVAVLVLGAAVFCYSSGLGSRSSGVHLELLPSTSYRGDCLGAKDGI